MAIADEKLLRAAARRLRAAHPDWVIDETVTSRGALHLKLSTPLMRRVNWHWRVDVRAKDTTLYVHERRITTKGARSDYWQRFLELCTTLVMDQDRQARDYAGRMAYQRELQPIVDALAQKFACFVGKRDYHNHRHPIDLTKLVQIEARGAELVMEMKLTGPYTAAAAERILSVLSEHCVDHSHPERAAHVAPTDRPN